MLDGQPHGEGGPVARRAFDGDGAAVGLGYPATDAEAKPGPALDAASGLVYSVEAVEDVRQVLRGDAHAGVADPQLDLLAVHPPAGGDPAARRRVLDAVVQEVEKELQQQVLVGLQGQGGAGR